MRIRVAKKKEKEKLPSSSSSIYTAVYPHFSIFPPPPQKGPSMPRRKKGGIGYFISKKEDETDITSVLYLSYTSGKGVKCKF